MRVGEVEFKAQIENYKQGGVAATIELWLEPKMRRMIGDSRIRLKYFRS